MNSCVVLADKLQKVLELSQYGTNYPVISTSTETIEEQWYDEYNCGTMTGQKAIEHEVQMMRQVTNFMYRVVTGLPTTRIVVENFYTAWLHSIPMLISKPSFHINQVES